MFISPLIVPSIKRTVKCGVTCFHISKPCFIPVCSETVTCTTPQNLSHERFTQIELSAIKFFNCVSIKTILYYLLKHKSGSECIFCRKKEEDRERYKRAYGWMDKTKELKEIIRASGSPSTRSDSRLKS